MDLERTVGLRPAGAVWLPERRAAVSSILLKLAAMGVRIPPGTGEEDVLHLAGDLFARYREQTRLLSEHLCPADRRIQRYLDNLLAAAGSSEPVRLPSETLILDRYGLARELSLPIDAESWHNDLVSSYRLDNGVLHNPVNDRRTTQGVFHVAEGGLPIPADKLRVPLATYLRLLDAALRPPAELLRLPFTANWPEPVETMVSLLLRPLVCPAVPKSSPEKRTEVRFFVPGGLVSNLDFVESIFGNAGDPYLPGTTPASTSTTGPATAAASSWRRTSRSCGRRTSACRTRAAPPMPSAPPACAGKTRASSTTTAAPSRSPRAGSTA